MTGRHPYSLSHNFIINMFSLAATGRPWRWESETGEPSAIRTTQPAQSITWESLREHQHHPRRHHQLRELPSSSKWWSPGCVNAAGKVRVKQYAKEVIKFTKPRDCLVAKPCKFACPAFTPLTNDAPLDGSIPSASCCKFRMRALKQIGIN